MNLFKGLMFLEGHFTRPEDIDDDLVPSVGTNAERAATAAAPSPSLAPAPAPRLSLLQDLLLLGGRPMHAGHNLDLDEPFELAGAANQAPRDDVACRLRHTAPICDLAALA